MRSRPMWFKTSGSHTRSWSPDFSRAFPLDSKKSTVAAMISPERASGYLRCRWLGLSNMAVTPRDSYQDEGDGTATAQPSGAHPTKRGSARRARQQITPLGQAAGALGRPKVALPGGVAVAERV